VDVIYEFKTTLSVFSIVLSKNLLLTVKSMKVGHTCFVLHFSAVFEYILSVFVCNPFFTFPSSFT
jgi:hypothetical protein